MKCQMCGEKEAVYKITIPGYKGNAAKFRCEECAESAKRSYDDVEVEEIQASG